MEITIYINYPNSGVSCIASPNSGVSLVHFGNDWICSIDLISAWPVGDHGGSKEKLQCRTAMLWCGYGMAFSTEHFALHVGDVPCHWTFDSAFWPKRLQKKISSSKPALRSLRSLLENATCLNFSCWNLLKFGKRQPQIKGGTPQKTQPTMYVIYVRVPMNKDGFLLLDPRHWFQGDWCRYPFALLQESCWPMAISSSCLWLDVLIAATLADRIECPWFVEGFKLNGSFCMFLYFCMGHL